MTDTPVSDSLTGDDIIKMDFLPSNNQHRLLLKSAELNLINQLETFGFCDLQKAGLASHKIAHKEFASKVQADYESRRNPRR